MRGKGEEGRGRGGRGKGGKGGSGGGERKGRRSGGGGGGEVRGGAGMGGVGGVGGKGWGFNWGSNHLFLWRGCAEAGPPLRSEHEPKVFAPPAGAGWPCGCRSRSGLVARAADHRAAGPALRRSDDHRRQRADALDTATYVQRFGAWTLIPLALPALASLAGPGRDRRARTGPGAEPPRRRDRDSPRWPGSCSWSAAGCCCCRSRPAGRRRAATGPPAARTGPARPARRRRGRPAGRHPRGAKGRDLPPDPPVL